MSEGLGLEWLLGQRSGELTHSLPKGPTLLLAPGPCSCYVSGMVTDTQ